MLAVISVCMYKEEGNLNRVAQSNTKPDSQ